MIRAITAIVLITLMASTARASVALKETTLYNFTTALGSPSTGLISGGSGVFYGAAGRSIYRLSQSASKTWQVVVIHSFPAGAVPTGLIISGGVIYGIDGQSIFALTPSTTTPVTWSASTIQTFKPFTAGPSLPVGLLSPKTGLIYLTTEAGGGATACGSDDNKPLGCGTLSELTLANKKWTATVLISFAGGSDGAMPTAAPSLGSDGNIYLSTFAGGASSSSAAVAPDRTVSVPGCGTVMLIPDNSTPQQVATARKELLKDCDDDKYEGLAGAFRYFADTLAPSGQHSLSKTPATTGFLLGSSAGGGNPRECAAEGNDGCGVIFSLREPADKSTPWSFQKLHNFSGPDGVLPFGSLLVNGSQIYGVAAGGNYICAYPAQASGCGVIYALETNDVTGFTYAGTAYKFTGVPDGALPNDGLVVSNGQILGTTAAGGKYNNGVIFALTP